MYQLQADPNASRPPITSPLANPPAFSPPRYAIWVNSLWFLSLVISLSCAMLATLLQQWARRYVRATQVLRCSPEKRARMRSFFANGVDKFHVSWAVETLPTLVHISLLMFFAGLLIYLFYINSTVFGIVVCWVGLTSAAYVCITLMPIFWHDSPYYVPLSSAILLLYAAIPCALFGLLRRIAFRRDTGPRVYVRYDSLWERYRDFILGGIGKAAEKAASTQSLEINGRILEWTIDALNQDDELEKFLEIIPGFYKTYVTRNLGYLPPTGFHEKIKDTVGQFLVRTLSSSLVPASVTNRRFVTCLNAAHVVGGLSLVAGVLQTVLESPGVDWQGVPRSVEIGHFLRHWVSSSYGENILEVQCMIAVIILSVQERDSRWMALTLDQLGLPEQVLENYLTHGESVLLANLVHIIRQLLRSGSFWVPVDVMRFLSKFDVHGTLPGLQHTFCAVWNEGVEECRKPRGKTRLALVILCYTRNVYIALHEGTDASPTAFSTSTDTLDDILWQPSSYPLCSDPDHLSESVPHAHDSGMGVAARALAITHPTDSHDDPTPDPITHSSLTGTDMPSFPTSNQGPATPNTTDDPSLDNMPSAITTSSHNDLQVPSSVEPATSLDQGMPMTTQDGSRRALTHLSGSSTSTVSGQQNADNHTAPPGPSTPPVSSISSPLLLPSPGHTPVILRSSTADSASLSDQNRPSLGICSPNSATTSMIDPQEASDSGPPVTLGKIDDPKN